MLSRYQEIDTNWNLASEDLNRTPLAKEFKPDLKNDIQRLVLSPFPWSDVTKTWENESPVALEYINEGRKNLCLVPFHKSSTVRLGSFSSTDDVIGEVTVRFSIRKFCEALGIYCGIRQLPYPPIELRGESFWCAVGWHDYEKEPQILEFVREKDDWINAIFGSWMSSGIQVGIRRCLCCGRQQYVKREGIMGEGNPRWRRCTKAKYEEVLNLPGIQ